MELEERSIKEHFVLNSKGTVRLIVEVIDKVKCWAYEGATVKCIKSDSFEHMAKYIAGVYKDCNILINKAGFGVALGQELEKLGCDFFYMGQEHSVTVEDCV